MDISALINALLAGVILWCMVGAIAWMIMS